MNPSPPSKTWWRRPWRCPYLSLTLGGGGGLSQTLYKVTFLAQTQNFSLLSFMWKLTFYTKMAQLWQTPRRIYRRNARVPCRSLVFRSWFRPRLYNPRFRPRLYSLGSVQFRPRFLQIVPSKFDVTVVWWPFPRNRKKVYSLNIWWAVPES